jgi:hypothetical protein
MITPDMAWDWHAYKATLGPTYAGSPGWAKLVDWWEKKMDAYGWIDKFYIDIPYKHYVVNDWPDKRSHMSAYEGAVERLYSDGTAVDIVASYAMTSGWTDVPPALGGSTPPKSITAQMIFYDPADPAYQPTPAAMKGKIVVYKTPPLPAPVPNLNGPYSYTYSILDSYTFTDGEYRSPGEWYPMYTPPPTSVLTNYYYRWVWGQVGSYMNVVQKDLKSLPVGGVVVYDYSPGGALGVTQRTVFADNVNIPTLTLDRVNGAKVIEDAKAGKTATLTLVANFQTDHGKGIIGFLPGKDYGSPQDEWVLLASHADAMSLIEENGSLGLLGIAHYYSHIPQEARPRTLAFYLDCRHFMPGGESAWPQYDYFNVFPEKEEMVVATVGMEHMAARNTIEVGPGGNTYMFSPEGPNSGGLGTSLIDVNNNNLFLIEKFIKAVEDNDWPRVDIKARAVEPGIQGGVQGSVKSPMNKGRSFKKEKPGVGLAGDWPGAATQTFAQLETEAGYPGIDKHYFVKQVAGLAQITGELMLVKPIVIDLDWGKLKSGLVCTSQPYCNIKPVSGFLPDSGFKVPADAAMRRQALVDQYAAAFRDVEAGAYASAISKLQGMKANVTSWIASPAALSTQIDVLITKLSAL